MYERTKEFRYADSRLRGTYCLTSEDNIPVFIEGIDWEDGSVRAVDINRDSSFVTSVNQLKFKEIQLGYINREEGNALFLVRVPRREDWRQGLRSNNVAIVKGVRLKSINNEIFYDLWKNYGQPRPNVEQCLQGPWIKSWNKDWAACAWRVFYRGSFDPVGIQDGQYIVLNKGYSHLKESLERSMGNEGIRVCTYKDAAA